MYAFLYLISFQFSHINVNVSIFMCEKLERHFILYAIFIYIFWCFMTENEIYGCLYVFKQHMVLMFKMALLLKWFVIIS